MKWTHVMRDGQKRLAGTLENGNYLEIIPSKEEYRAPRMSNKNFVGAGEQLVRERGVGGKQEILEPDDERRRKCQK